MAGLDKRKQHMPPIDFVRMAQEIAQAVFIGARMAWRVEDLDLRAEAILRVCPAHFLIPLPSFAREEQQPTC